MGTNKSNKSHLEFLDEFVETISKLRDEAKQNGYVYNKDVNYIEELYSTYSFFNDTEERFVKIQ